MTDPSGQAPKGRRSAAPRERRIDLLVALAIAAPAVVTLSVGLIGGEENPAGGPQSPTDAALTSATVVCPSGLDGAGTVRVTRTPDVPGGKLSVATAPAVTSPCPARYLVAECTTMSAPCSSGRTR